MTLNLNGLIPATVLPMDADGQSTSRRFAATSAGSPSRVQSHSRSTSTRGRGRT